MNPLDIPITVLADDLTGAAEIAGILRRFGFEPHLFRTPDRASARTTCVIDTDSRLLTPAAAAARVAEALRGIEIPQRVFKKIDSLLRGPVGAEIDAALDATSMRTALVLAQNPSRGRCVTGGLYIVDGVPLHQTPFRADPEYPRHTDQVVQYVRSVRRKVLIRDPGDAIIAGAINVVSAASLAEVDAWVSALDPTILPVGAADLLTSFVRRTGLPERTDPPIAFGTPRLIVAGSASAYARSLPPKARQLGIPAIAMCEDELEWTARLVSALGSSGIVLMHVGREVTGGLAVAERIQVRIAQCVAQVVRAFGTADLLVDGGATASAVIRELGWRELIVRAEVSPGVVALQSESPTRLTIKPGSYAWPDAVWVA